MFTHYYFIFFYSINILSSFIYFTLSHFSFLPPPFPAMMRKLLPVHREDPHLLYYTGEKKAGCSITVLSRFTQTKTKIIMTVILVSFLDKITTKTLNINLSFRMVIEWAIHADPQWRNVELKSWT